MRISLNQNVPIGVHVPYQSELVLSEQTFARPNITELTPVSFVGSLLRSEGGVMVEGEISYTLSTLCDCCLTPVTRQAKFSFSEFFGAEGTDEQEFDYALDGQVLDLTSAVTDAVLYELPGRIVCKEDCKGLCPVCGCNRNISSCECESLPDESNPFYALLLAQQDSEKK
ncbi:MAG: DUF177 domain-containing protein [Clostridia bacterium]|nr:DUF177 domain-containing protein [Clostridia bacterium]